MAVLALVSGAFLVVVSGVALDGGIAFALYGPGDTPEGEVVILVFALLLLVLAGPAANILLAIGIGMVTRPMAVTGRPWTGPAGAPPHAPTRPSLAGRALLAVALTVGFYVLAVGLAVLLLLFGVTQLAGGHVNRASIFSVIGGLAIAWSILPRRERFTPPGPLIDLVSNPLLAEHLRDVAARVREPPPSEVYLTFDVNAGVAQRGWLGAARYMVIGLPLMQLMTVSEFRAVLAHEFGHYHGGDTALGPWVYRTRRSILRVTQSAGAVSWLIWLPFRGYAWLYLRVTQAISRQQEYAADALAARTVGSRPMSSALRKLEFAAPALRTYLVNIVAPVVEAGFAPPLTAGFGDYLSHVSRGDRNTAGGDAPASAASTYDSHPPTAARLAALAALAPPDAADVAGEPAATSLLGEIVALEQGLIERLRPGAVLRPMAWDRVADEVYLPRWRAAMRQHHALLTGAALQNLTDWARASAGIGYRATGTTPRRMTEARAVLAGTAVLSRALTLALAAQGWRVEWLPSEPITCRRGEAVIQPYDTIARMAAGKLDADEWARMRDQLRIADASLAAVVAAT